MEEQIAPKRHGFITFWLWLGIVFGIIGFIAAIHMASDVHTFPNPLKYETLDDWQYALWRYEHASSITTMCIFYAIVSLVDACGSFLLLQRKKLGFWVRVGAAAIMVILTFIYGLSIAQGSGIGSAIGSAISTAIVAAIGIWILYAILKIRKDGVPYWNQLQ